MASGVGADTAPVLYFGDVNYNETDTPKSSYLNANCNIPILNNASNYQVAINKLKISDLSSVILGYLPYNEYQVALQLEDSAGETHFEQSYVSLPNATTTTKTFQYIASLNADFSITLRKYQSTTLIATILTFTPETVGGQPIIPQYVVYDSELENFIVATFNGLYLYDSSGVFVNDSSLADIVNCYYSTTARALLIAQNLPVATVRCLRVVGTAFVQQWTITDSKSLGVLTDIAAVSTDGQNVLVCWLLLGAPYATIYNYASQLAESESPLPINMTGISSCVISSSDGSFIVANNEYDPTLALACNEETASPYNNWEIWGVNPHTQKTTLGDNVTSISFSDSSTYALGVNVIAPYTYTNANWNGYSFATFTTGLAPGITAGTLQTSVSYVCGNSNLAIGLAFTPDNIFNPISCQLSFINANGTFNPFYTLPSMTVQPNGQISINPDNYIFATFGGALYVLSNPLTIGGVVPNQVPSVPAGSDWVLVSSNETSGLIQSVVWDDFLPNTGYALFGGSNHIYKIVFNPSNNTYSARQWYLTAQTYNSYITKATNYLPFGFTTNLLKFSINDFSLTTNTSLPFAQYIQSMALSRVEDYLYVVRSISTPVIYTLDYKTVASVGTGTITGISYNGVAGVFTSTETITPTLQQTAFYDLQEFIDAVNRAYLACYTALQAEISGQFPVDECPFWTLNFATKLLTLNYDPKFESVSGNGIFANTALLPLFNLSNVAGDQAGFYRYVLSPSGTQTQTKQSVYKAIFADKIVIKTNMTLLSDFENTTSSKSNQVFTDLDLDTSDAFFQLDGSFLYSAQLLRNYILISNSQLRSISYQIWIQYKDRSELPYLIPVGENVSLIFQFTRLY